MLEGTTPIDAIPPAVHTLVHYARAAVQFGVLKWYWLMAFERFNKKLKNIVGNKSCPISSLTNALLRDAGILITIYNTFHTHTNAHTPFSRVL